MTRSRSDLIAELAEDLRPARRPGRTAGLALAWLAGSWLLVVALTLATGPLRPGFAEQLLASPRFVLESLLGFAVGLGLVAYALQLGIPQPGSLWRRSAPGLLLLAAWIAVYIYGFWQPAIEPSMLGKRAHCSLQTLAFGVPPLVAGLLLLRRLAPIRRSGAAALLAAAAGSLPCLIMQIACMYEPAHILVNHFGPMLALVCLGALLGPLALRRL